MKQDRFILLFQVVFNFTRIFSNINSNIKKISIYCFILISLGFIGCTSKTHEKTIEDFDIREMSLQVDTLYSRMTQAARVAQLYGIRTKEIMEY